MHRLDPPIWINTLDETGAKESLGKLIGTFFSDKEAPIRIGVLGSKTTSEEVGLHLSSLVPGGRVQIVGMERFELLLRALQETEEIDAALIPHASPMTNYFYQSRNLMPVGLLVRETSSYGLACMPGKVLPASGTASVALISASDPVLQEVIPASGVTITRIAAFSNADAARRVAEGEADFAVTNDIARSHYRLEWAAEYGSFQMGWTIFARKETEK